MSADTRLKALREKTSGSNDNFDNRIAALRSTPAATTGNPVDLLPKPEKTKNDNHDVLHSIAPATTASEIKEASVNKAKSDANTIGMINDVIWGDVRNIPSRIGAWSDARKALKSGEIPMDYSGANFNPATDLYVKQQNERAEKERTDKQNEIKAQLEDIDKQIRQSKATAAQYRARTGGLANSAGRAEAQRMVDDANRKTEELQQQRQKLMNELHSVGGKYGVGDIIGDTGEMVFSNAGLQAPDLIDYYLSRGVGLIDENDKEAYDRAHALQYDRAQQIAEAQSGRGQFGQDYMQAAAAFGDMLSNTAMAYASGVPQALQAYGSAPAAALQNSGIHDLDPSIAGRVISGADKLTGNILADAIAAPTNVAISLSSGVHTFDEAKTKGASTGQAFAAALGSAAAEYFSNKMFSGTPLENNPGEKGYVVEAIESFSKWLGKEEQVKKFFSNKLASFIFDKTGEGWEEVITAVLEPWIAHATYDKDADLATLKELWNEWYIGTFMSVIADATEPVTNFRAQKAEAREKENEQRRQNAMAQYLAYAAGNANADFHETVSNNYDLLKNANPADIAKAYNVGRNYNRESVQKQSDLETLAAGTMGAEGLKLAAEKRGTMADTDPVAYYNEARQAYDMGRTGEENTFKGEILSTKEANAWYNAGIYDAKEETNEQRQSGNESQGRVDGLDSQRQGGRLAEGAGGQLAGEAAEGQRDGGSPVQANDGGRVSRKEATVKLSQGQALTSAAENGISNGTEAKTMHVISEDTMDQWHPEMVEVYNKGKQNGIAVKYYTGRMALDDGHGVFFVRGLNVGDGSVVWIRADADEDIRKIADHEFFHTAEKRDPGLKQRILDKITENKQAKTLQALTQKYADKYDGSGLSDDEILSEICADSYGGIDIFAGITDAKDATEEQKARATDLSETVRGAVIESKPTGWNQKVNTEKDKASREIGLPEAERKTLEKNNATVADGVVIADTLTPIMESPEFHKPVSVSDLADLASHDTLPAWAEKYINGGGSKEALKAIQHFDDIIWKSVGGNVSDAQKLLQELVPSGNIKAGKFGPLRENVEYRRSFDMDTSCPRTFQFVEYRNAIQKRINRTLTFEESVNLINLMAAYHQMIPCTYCYVENKRILKASYYNKFYAFHNAVMNGVRDGLDVEDLKPLMYGWDAEKKKLTSAAEKVLTEEWMNDKSGYNPTIEENYHTVNLIRNAAMHLLDGMRDERKINANTTIKSLTNIIASEYGIKSKEALKEVEKMAEDWQYDVSRNAEHMYLVPDIGEEFDRKIADRALALDNEAIGYANSASSAKSVDNYVPYGGELENISDEDRDFIIGMGGIRKHSSNDFRIDYVLDYFQFFADLAKGKWTGHTYTKSADYVRIFGRTGDMINMSIAFNDTADGVSENVNEGMEHKLAQELRKAYANAGVMAMVTSDKQLSYALNADWVDMIIPFHNSGLPKEIWYNMKAWTDYTSVQSEALYNGDEMKAALSSRGIDTKGMKADQVRDLFYQTFGIKQVVKQEDKDKKNIGKQFAPHFYPYETKQYGVTIPGHDNSKSKYLALCREYGVHPRFDGVIVKDAEGKDINIVDHPNYMKVVREASRATENFKQPAIEFSFNKADPYLTEKYGNEYGKKSVTPMDYAMARLNEEAGNGGYKNAAEDQFGIVDEFVRDYAGKGRSIGWLSERAGMVKDELDSVQDKIVDANRKATLEEFKETAGEKAKPKVRSNFYTNQVSREETGKNKASRETDIGDATVYNRTVVLKEDTVDKYLKDYAAESSPKYAQAYIAYMTPDKFLDLTTSAAGRSRIANETGPLDLDELKNSNVDQPIQLIIDHETGEVTGHEGRHRMKALMRAGVENIPVLLFDSSNKYSKTAIDKLVLKGQFDDRAFATVRDMQPLSYENRDAVMQKVTTQPTTERLQEKYNGRETVRYSREDDTNRLMQENTDLRQRLDAALADTKQTTAWRANTKDVARVADDIIEATSSKESKAIVAQKIRSLVEAASNGGIDSTEMKDLALDIARGLLKRSSVLTTKDSTTYDGMRDYLKSVYINVPSEMRKEITDWKAFAAAHKAMRMKTTGVAINEVYKEMQKRMGKDYFPDIDSDIDKLRQIAEVLDTLTPVYDNPYSVNMAEATEETANSILESILNIGQAAPTYADRAKARENEVRELYQQKLADQKAYLQQRIQDEADKRKQQTEAVKQHYTEMQENRRLRKQDSEARQKLLRVAKRLQNRKLDAVNRAMVDQLIGDLDTVSVNLTNRSLTNLKELADWYDSYKDDPNFLTDPQVEKKLFRLEKRHIGEMTLDEVRDLTDVLRSIENALATYGKMVRIEDHRLISEMSEQSQENIRNTKGSKKNIADWLVTNTLAPERLLRRLTGYNDSDPLYMRVKELSEGQRKMMDYQMRAEALFSKWTNDKKLIERLRDKDTIKVRAFVDGKETTIEITPDMRMALYLHSLNDQNLKHIMNGGIRIPDIELYRNGDTKEAYSRGVTAKMSPDMVRGIANGMSAEERAFANAAKAYFNGMSRDEINAVSEALLGYSLANVENYFPIQTDDAFTMKEIDAIQNDGSIQGMGFTKERQNASNAIYLVPMTDVLKRSIQNHAKYVGMAIPVANMNRLWMANTKDGETDTTSGLKDTMRSKWGDRANEAVEKILTDVQNPVRKTDDVSKALAKVRSNYAGAVLTLNASVAMKQAASYPTAAAVLGWEPLLKAMKNYGKVDLDLIAKYTPLQWYRSQGFSTQELGDIKSQSGLMDKVLSAHITTKDGREIPLLNWIQGIDLMTTRKLWKASEYYVQQNQKDLKPGTDDYYKAVADIYNRVIEETQPNYTTMQRPQLLRSDNQLLQSLVMFKTQPFQNFNILYDAIGELRAAETMAKNGDPSRLKQARQNAVNAVTSNLVSAVVFAAMTMAWALARRKREKYEDDEGNFSPWGQLGKDILSSELGMIPFGSDAYNLLASMFLGEKYYGMTNITSDSLSGMTESTLNAFNTLKETVTALLDDDEKTQADPEKIARKLFATAKDASKLLGIPTENVLNLMTAVYSNVASAVNGEYTTAYEVLRLEKGFTSSSSKSTAYDILYKAYQNDRSQYNELRGMMVDDGFKESSIDSAMKKRSSK